MNDPSSGGMGGTQILRIVIFFAMFIAVGWLLYTIRSTLAPFFLAFVLSYLLMPIVNFLESYRVHRLVAVVGVLMTVFAIVIIPLILVAPMIARGAEDMVKRMIGEQGTWHCVIKNSGDTALTIDRVENQLEDFEVDGLFEGDARSLKLNPGERDTFRVVFSPQADSARRDTLKLYGSAGGQQGVVTLTLAGNVSDTLVAKPTQSVSDTLDFGKSKISMSAMHHAFGTYKPGYLALVKSYTKTFQAKLEKWMPMIKEWMPMLEGKDVIHALHARLQSIATDVFKETPGLIGQLLSGLTFIIIVPLVLFFFLAEGKRIKHGVIELVPNRYFELVLNLLYRIDLQLGGYMRGMVLSVMIVSLLSITLLYIIGIEQFLVIGLLAGLANVIPYLGPLIGIIAGVIAAVLQYSALSVAVVFPVVVVFLIVQVIDNVFVAPVVVARSVNLHPLIVIFAVLAGSELFGAVGMLLAVPATAVIKVSVQTIYEALQSYSV